MSTWRTSGLLVTFSKSLGAFKSPSAFLAASCHLLVDLGYFLQVGKKIRILMQSWILMHEMSISINWKGAVRQLLIFLPLTQMALKHGISTWN